MSDFWIASVGGAIIARELAVLARRPTPDDDLVAGLLRDLGEVLLRQAFADTWADHVARHGDRLITDPCGAEQASFGIDHADAGGELLRSGGCRRKSRTRSGTTTTPNFWPHRRARSGSGANCSGWRANSFTSTPSLRTPSSWPGC